MPTHILWTTVALVSALWTLSTEAGAGSEGRQESTPPRVVERVFPEYPPEEEGSGIEGRVVIETMIRADGPVEVIRVVRSLGPRFDRAAMAALEKWVFEPATVNGRPVDERLRIELTFTLE